MDLLDKFEAPRRTRRWIDPGRVIQTPWSSSAVVHDTDARARSARRLSSPIMKFGWSFFALACIALSSCVSKKQYQALEASKADMEATLKRKNDDCVEKNAALVASIAQLEAEKGEKEKKIHYVFFIR